MAWEYGPDCLWEWPDELDKKSYSKAVKAGEMGGIWVALDEAKKYFLTLQPPLFPKKRAPREVAEEYADKANNTYKSPEYAKLRRMLEGINKMLDTMMKKKSELEKDSVSACQKIQQAISICADNIDPKGVEHLIKKYFEEAIKGDKEFLVPQLGGMFNLYRDVTAGKHASLIDAVREMAKWPQDESNQEEMKLLREKIDGHIKKAARRMTQGLGSLLRAMEYEVVMANIEPRDREAAPKLAKSLLPIANDNAKPTEGKTKEEIVKLLRTMDVHAKLFDMIGSRLPSAKELEEASKKKKK